MIGFPALAITFIVLKLTHVIHWPWLWVLAPIWISVLVGVAVFAVGGWLITWVRNA